MESLDYLCMIVLQIIEEELQRRECVGESACRPKEQRNAKEGRTEGVRVAECEDTAGRRNGELIFPFLSTLENCVYWWQWAGMGRRGGARGKEGGGVTGGEDEERRRASEEVREEKFTCF